MSKIVAVDDEKMVTSALKTLFKIEGYSDINLFNSTKEALEFLADNKPDLIISDFIMPEMNGLEFLREAKKLYPEVSMILLTGYADKENAIKAINEVGLYKYIEKPWDNDDLLMNVRNGIVSCVAMAMIVWTLMSEHPDTGVLRILAVANTVFIALICGMLTYKNFRGAVISFRDNDIKGVLVSLMICLTAVGAGVYFIAVR